MFKCPPFGVVRDREVGHRIGVRLVGAAQLDVARHDGSDEVRLSEEGRVEGPKFCAEGWRDDGTSC